MRTALSLALAFVAGGTLAAGEGQLRVVLPTDATLTVNGVQSRQSGSERVISSQDIEPGREYYYTVEATAYRNGQPVTERRSTSVRAGEETTIRFYFPEAQAAQVYQPQPQAYSQPQSYAPQQQAYQPQAYQQPQTYQPQAYSPQAYQPQYQQPQFQQPRFAQPQYQQPTQQARFTGPQFGGGQGFGGGGQGFGGGGGDYGFNQGTSAGAPVSAQIVGNAQTGYRAQYRYEDGSTRSFASNRNGARLDGGRGDAPAGGFGFQPGRNGGGMLQTPIGNFNIPGRR